MTEIDDTRVLLGHNSYMKVLMKPQQHSSMIDVNQGAHLVGSERYANTIKGSQGSIQHEEKGFRSSVLEK
jgi:hypothetical protein